ncbi:hypothetical protein [uncultured Corynebacterium sp.]|uniref:hypothetical protein n=1 Tax=uncultured Corynebacterium sp. TaxID=159447 RepID=UPI002615C9C7|nr:hypothetical protein [uncultured Corynebacterium sp.]
MKKRTSLIVATLSAAMVFGAAPALAQTDADDANTTADAVTTTDTGNTDNTTDESNAGDQSKADPEADPEAEERDPNELDPTKDIWDKNGASSQPAPNGSFEKLKGLNRAAAYFQSNHFKMVSTIVAAIAAVITVGSQLLAIIISVSPTAKAQLGAFFK